MPVETAEIPIKPTQQINPVRADVRKFLPEIVRDEFTTPKTQIVKPKPIKIEGNEELTDAFNKALEGDFKYFSAAYDLEVNTERTGIIQGVVDKLAVGENLETRVVIMRRGLKPNAFVVPDGTIFIVT